MARSIAASTSPANCDGRAGVECSWACRHSSSEEALNAGLPVKIS